MAVCPYLPQLVLSGGHDGLVKVLYLMTSPCLFTIIHLDLEHG